MRLVGLEVAGWSDVGARDWDYDDLDGIVGPIRVIDGGIGISDCHETLMSGQPAVAGHPPLVDKIARILLEELKTVAGSGDPSAFKTRFKNALSALAGLFRYREAEPYALLLKGEDRVAATLWADLKTIEDSVVSVRHSVFQAEAKIGLVGELLELLEGRGDPNILRRIEASDAEDANDWHDKQ